MKDHLAACAKLDNEALTISLKQLRNEEKNNLAVLIAHLVEFDKRKLYADSRCPSLFVYCTSKLGYSEPEAAWRIYTARAVEKFPRILPMLEAGELHLTAIVTLSAHLTEENHLPLLLQARGRSKQELEMMVAALAPKPDIGDCVRRTPAASSQQPPSLPLTSGEPPFPQHFKSKIAPLAPSRVHFGFTGSEDLLKLLRRAQEILKHKYPAGDLDRIFEEALEAFLDKKDPDRRLLRKEERAAPPAPCEEPKNDNPLLYSRYIPQAVRDVVWRRDGGQCVHVDADKERCVERGGLEFDHIVPYALGGPSNNPANIRLLCKTHNQLWARRVFGEAAMKYDRKT